MTSSCYDFLEIFRRKNVQMIMCTYISCIHILAEIAQVW